LRADLAPRRCGAGWLTRATLADCSTTPSTSRRLTRSSSASRRPRRATTR